MWTYLPLCETSEELKSKKVEKQNQPIMAADAPVWIRFPLKIKKKLKKKADWATESNLKLEL